ncbi:ORF-112 [Agrotis segetum nucleopolyhedrovirus A]|uniref:ORF-112 n=1 Tax=Agrotis segetum nuclear polyhedrosis virus TaxID=1962501 RepID=Q287G0_NPVAS|nr:ORF-112 [Agrotis segetum nucleopolyhedrovirus A]AAZ38278.1 ORF-112 [Agrotis segetum nucleopolyhedrovirus A]
MSQINFKLKEVINNTVDTKLKDNSRRADNLASFYDKCKTDASRVGRSTTYDVVGKRDYKTLFDEKKYKF